MVLDYFLPGALCFDWFSTFRQMGAFSSFKKFVDYCGFKILQTLFSGRLADFICSTEQLARRKKSLPWQNDLFEESLRAVGVSGVEVGTTVYVTNLDQGVTNEDIKV